ncbi:MAG: trigger factor [Balneolaceae bacterium]
MNISVQDLTSVDKEIAIKAKREDLSERFEKAYKKYQGKITLPGFRPGRVPLSIIRKRFGSEIELEEINGYIQEVFEKEIVPEHNPVGESEMLDLVWEDDELEVSFKIGKKPSFELVDVSTLSVERMVHDVTEEEVDEEIERTLERQGNWELVDGKIEADHRVTVDVESLDEEGEPVEGQRDEDQVLNLSEEGAAEFREALVGKKSGDVVDMEAGDGEEKDRFRLHVKKVESPDRAELTDEFAKEQSNGEARNTEEFRSFIKSKMQDYYDQTSGDLFKQEIINVLVEAHEFEIPDVFEKQVLNNYVEYLKQQSGGNLPPTFDFEGYKERMSGQAKREAKWFFINQELQESYDDIEITPDDIDTYITTEAARYGATAEQMKQYFAQDPSQLESLRTSIRENKVFDKLREEVDVKELSKDEYREKQEKEQKAEQESNA